MKKAAAVCFALYSLISASCHRPYARYQPMPVERFQSPLNPTPTLTPTAETGITQTAPAPTEPDWKTLLADSAHTPSPAPDLYASARPVLPDAPLRHRVQHVRSMTAPTTTPETGSRPEAFPQPRPKPRTGEKKTLREILGLKPRKKLNWWQRIHWSLKAAVPVILIAVVFALTKITILAIIFGLLGAFLLIRGLKKEFKVRRPWF